MRRAYSRKVDIKGIIIKSMFFYAPVNFKGGFDRGFSPKQWVSMVF